LLVEGFELGEHVEERGRSHRFDDQARPFLSKGGSTPGQFPITGNSQRLMPAVSEEPNLPFRVHAVSKSSNI
jgi:hypothetical protein